MGRTRQGTEEDPNLPIEELYRWNKSLAKHPLNISAFNTTMSRAEMMDRGLYEEGVLMARIKHQTEVINKRTGLTEWMPSSPKRPGKYIIHTESSAGSRYSVIFAACFAAKKFIDGIIGEDKSSWKSDKKIQVKVKDEEITITSDLLEEIMEHEYNKAEDQWELPSPYSNYVRHIRGGKQIEVDETKPKQEPPKSRQTSRKPRESREGLVTAINLAAEFKLKPIELRALLRKMKLIKPAAGWAWNPKEAEEVRKKIKKEL